MDEVAQHLKSLEKAGVPVIWRPFHEFDGAWFWWGKGGAELFKKLWILMYERYTNHFNLNNLIWVLGYSHQIKSGWYPGDEYLDITGADDYEVGTNIEKYLKVKKECGGRKPITYHECGPIPNPDDLIADKAHWLWFLTWHTIHIKEQNTPEHLSSIYHHPYVITRDMLPDFHTFTE